MPCGHITYSTSAFRMLRCCSLTPRMDLTLTVHRSDGTRVDAPVLCRIDTLDEVAQYRHGGILQYVPRGMVKVAWFHTPGEEAKRA
jgi:aconitase A